MRIEGELLGLTVLVALNKIHLVAWWWGGRGDKVGISMEFFSSVK